ncbi:MAG: hypothetical protein PHS79_03495 [Patescibacteria group bacterium]|nr:hypothetical protein [Patescibacteria group bacterium]
MSNNQCITYTNDCINSFGLNVYGTNGNNNNSSCYCNTGYQWDDTKTSCILIPTNQQTETADSEQAAYITGNEAATSQFASGLYDPLKNDLALTRKLAGSILLQVQSHGEAWYVNPLTNNRSYMKDGDVAYQIMRSFGQGITDVDLSKISSANTTDEIKTASNVCSSNSLANRMKGKILLQVQQHGEAYYVYPKNCRMIYMKDGATAYGIMRFLGQGIADADLAKIPANE